MKVNLHSLKVLLRVIHLPWLCTYALVVTPLINSLCHHQLDVSQAWFADDATAAAGQLTPLLRWLKQLLSLGPLYGYYPYVTKTNLIVKPQLYNSAKQLFQDTNVQITCHSQCHLSAAIGTWLFTEEHVSKKVKIWSDEILTLTIAEIHPHSAHCAFSWCGT